MINFLCGDVIDMLKTIPTESIQCVVTSPPYYGLRDYGKEGQIGLEETPELYVKKLTDVFSEVRRTLRKDGTLWLNLGDSYNGSGGAGGDYNEGGLKEGQPKYKGRHIEGLKPKDLVMIPARVALSLQATGWYLRSDIIWHKPNPMPESVEDRPSKSYEHLFLFAKSEQYYYDAEAIMEDSVDLIGSAQRYKTPFFAGKKHESGDSAIGAKHTKEMKSFSGKRNARDVWTINVSSYKGAHFATFPEELALRCILAGSRVGDTVLDPFCGSGTVGYVAASNSRNATLIDLNEEYIDMAKTRCGFFAL